MKKFLLLVVILLIAGGGFIYVSLGGVVKTVMIEQGSLATGTAVNVEAVKINFLEGRVTVTGLSVANPDGFTTPHAFAVDEISVTINLSEMISRRVVVVDEVFIDNPSLVYEKIDGKTNLDAIKGNAEGGSSEASSEEDGLKFIVSKIEFTDGQIRALGLSPTDPDIDAVLPGFVLSDIGASEGGVPASVVANRVTVAITGRVIEAVLAGAIFGALTDPVGTVTNPLKGILGGGD